MLTMAAVQGQNSRAFRQNKINDAAFHPVLPDLSCAFQPPQYRPSRCSTSLAELPIRLSGSSSGGSSGAGSGSGSGAGWGSGAGGGMTAAIRVSSSAGSAVISSSARLSPVPASAASVLSSCGIVGSLSAISAAGAVSGTDGSAAISSCLLLPIFSGDFSAGMGGATARSVASPSAVTQPDSSNKPIRGRPMTWTAERWRRMIMENAEKENNLQAGFQ